MLFANCAHTYRPCQHRASQSRMRIGRAAGGKMGIDYVWHLRMALHCPPVIPTLMHAWHRHLHGMRILLHHL
jgi:hypothetical protein